MATFGTLPGVKVSTTGGSISGVTVGRSQYLILIGHGDNDVGAAPTNEVVDIRARSDADAKFGPNTDLARAYRQAIANSANKNLIKAVMTENTSEAESFAGSATGTLANAPIVDDIGGVTVTDTTAGDDIAVSFVYESSVSAPTTENTVNLNPITGDFAADASADYDIEYTYSDWAGALTAAEDAFDESEFGMLVPLTGASSVANALATTISAMRTEYKMALGLMAAEPNATASDGTPSYDTANYTDAVDDDTIFLVAPATSTNEDVSALGAYAGIFVGNDASDPIYNDTVSGISGLTQKLSKSEADNLRNEQVIPIRDRGTIRIRDNLSTSTESDWERDYWRRRIVDLVVATVKEAGEAIFGQINDGDTRSTAETLLRTELEAFAADGLIRSNTEAQENMFVDVFRKDVDAVGIDFGITPYGIVKQVDVSLTINT